MRALAIALPLALLGHSAHANECNAYGQHMSTANVPLGCPAFVVVPVSDTMTMPPFQPKVRTTRYDPHTGAPMDVDLTGTITRDPDTQLLIGEYHYHANCYLEYDGLQPEPYAKFEVALAGAQVGDLLEAGQYDGTMPHVVAAGPCPAFAQPELACADPVGSCNADGGIGDPVTPPGANHDGGCNAGGGGAAGLALVTLCFVCSSTRRRAARTRRAP